MPKLVFHGWVEPHQIHQGNHCLFVQWRPRLIGLCSATQNLWRMSWFVILPLVLQNLFEKFLVIHKDRARMCSFVSIRERRMKMKSMQKNFPAIVALIYFLFASLAIQKPNCFSHECPSWLAQKMDFSKHPF